ncbi:hypothetical protein ACFQDF_24625 [Ectobacillus funiculus]
MKWCNHISFHWEHMKPRFLKLFDLKSLEEWEEVCCKLKDKLQAELKVDSADFQTANSLYEQWELLYREAHAYREKVE